MTMLQMTAGAVTLALSTLLAIPALADQPAPIDACKLLTSDEIAAVTGKKVGAPIPKGAGSTAEDSYSSTCVWRIAGDSDQPTADVPLQGTNYAMLNAWSWLPGSDGPKRFLADFRDAAKKDLIDMVPVAVPVGDEALYWGDGVAVRKGPVNFGISVHLQGGKPTEQTMETELAKKVLGRL
jgi:hypothetical protein